MTTDEILILTLFIWDVVLSVVLLSFMVLQSSTNRETMAFLRNLMDTLGRLR